MYRMNRGTPLKAVCSGFRFISYQALQVGKVGTESYKVYVASKDIDGTTKIISPFHDVPLYSDKASGIVNMIVEIPRWSNAKLEISSKLSFNPIVQDSKKGNLRYIANVFPFKGFLHTYGALPQTWEDPNKVDELTGYSGDNDPLDILEIGSGLFNSLTNGGFGPKPYTGQIKQVKILGCLAMIDEGETDWKILAIDTKDPLCEALNDIDDVNNSFPTLVSFTRDWFKYYKVPDGKGINSFAFNGEARNKEFAMKVIDDCHESWTKLINQKNSDSGIALENSILKDSEGYKTNFELLEEFTRVEEQMTQPLDKFHYVSRNE